MNARKGTSSLEISMRHTFVFRGTTEINPRLRVDATHFPTVKGVQCKIRRPKSTGLVFGFVEAPEGMAISQVDDIPLRTRVVIDTKRHLEGGGLGPNGRNIGDKAAARVLSDVMRANRSLAPLLKRRAAKLRGTS